MDPQAEQDQVERHDHAANGGTTGKTGATLALPGDAPADHVANEADAAEEAAASSVFDPDDQEKPGYFPHAATDGDPTNDELVMLELDPAGRAPRDPPPAPAGPAADVGPTAADAPVPTLPAPAAEPPAGPLHGPGSEPIPDEANDDAAALEAGAEADAGPFLDPVTEPAQGAAPGPSNSAEAEVDAPADDGSYQLHAFADDPGGDTPTPQPAAPRHEPAVSPPPPASSTVASAPGTDTTAPSPPATHQALPRVTASATAAVADLAPQQTFPNALETDDPQTASASAAPAAPAPNEPVQPAAFTEAVADLPGSPTPSAPTEIAGPAAPDSDEPTPPRKRRPRRRAARTAAGGAADDQLRAGADAAELSADDETGDPDTLLDYESSANPAPADEPVEEAETALPRGAVLTIPLLCAGVGLLACCLIIPLCDGNRRAAYERLRLRRDLESLQRQVATNDDFLHKVANDPSLAERLAQRQMHKIRAGTRVLPLHDYGGGYANAGDPAAAGASGSGVSAPMSPFQIVAIPPPRPLPAYRPLGGRIDTLCYNPHSRLYLMGCGLMLLAAGLVFEYNPLRVKHEGQNPESETTTNHEEEMTDTHDQ